MEFRQNTYRKGLRAVKIKGSWNCGRSLEITEKDVPIQVLESGRCSGGSAKNYSRALMPGEENLAANLREL